LDQELCFAWSTLISALCQLLFEAAAQQLHAGIGSRIANLHVTFDNALGTFKACAVLCGFAEAGGSQVDDALQTTNSVPISLADLIRQEAASTYRALPKAGNCICCPCHT